MYNCGCDTHTSQDTRGNVSTSPIVIGKEFENIPTLDISEDRAITPLAPVVELDNHCNPTPFPIPECKRKDPYEPIIVEPGNDILLGIKLRTTDDMQVIDINADTIENMVVKVGDASISYYIDPTVKCLLHTKVDASIIQEEGKYDIIVSGIWNGDLIEFTFHDKIIVTSKEQDDPAASLRQNISSEEEYIGSAVFIPAPYTYKSEEELRLTIETYQDMIAALEVMKREIEKEREKLINLAEEVLPEIRDDVSVIVQVGAKEATLKKSTLDILSAISGIPQTDLRPILNRLDSEKYGLKAIMHAIQTIDFTALAKEDTLVAGITDILLDASVNKSEIKELIDNDASIIISKLDALNAKFEEATEADIDDIINNLN